MAQSSRPSISRTHSTPAPPISPRNSSEKTTDNKRPPHIRRKSGKDHVVSTEKKSTRPTMLHRKTAPQNIQKVASSKSKERERDYDSGDSGESFPQFCMTCEKQFVPANNTFLYCSEECRLDDHAPTYCSPSNPYAIAPNSPPLTPYNRPYSSVPSMFPEESRDIVPRASPTQSRPRSYYNESPYPTDFSIAYQIPPASLPSGLMYASESDGRVSHSSTALASLRELATALPRTQDPESPPTSSLSRTSSHVWNYMPFTSKTTAPTPLVTPGNSYSNSSASFQAQARRSREDLYSFGNGQTYTNTGGMGMDRPLPPRTGPSGYGHRPRSIDLVTPFPTGV